jgi:signal peptidase II
MIGRKRPIIFYFIAMKKYWLPISVLIGVLALDQVLKISIKTNMVLGEEINVIGDWFRLHFTENNGMAFGLEFGGNYGKIALSIFRMLASIAIGWYIVKLVKTNEPKGLIVSLTLILAGAIGNLIDCAFYGMIFNESFFQPAVLFPPEGGYSTFLMGRVVDMLYFPVIDTIFPNWVPIWGGKHFIFFRPVFNLSDTAITTGVFYILIFQRNFLKKA